MKPDDPRIEDDDDSGIVLSVEEERIAAQTPEERQEAQDIANFLAEMLRDGIICDSPNAQFALKKPKKGRKGKA